MSLLPVLNDSSQWWDRSGHQRAQTRGAHVGPQPADPVQTGGSGGLVADGLPAGGNLQIRAPDRVLVLVVAHDEVEVVVRQGSPPGGVRESPVPGGNGRP